MASLTPLVHSSPSSSLGSSHPAASSAPVLEYLCLFTHDLRRKQKRWQDGRIKYHAFNKKIMVYDERGNFVGENHWREDYDFGDGEEVQLERGGIIVQAGECVGSRDQDLSELIDKRVQEKVERRAAAIARHSQPRPALQTPAASRGALTSSQLRHTPLQNLLGAQTGHYGRAQLPSESPFEQRQRSNAQQKENRDEDSHRPTKRRRREVSPPSKSGYAQSLFGATLTLSGRPMSSVPTQHKPRYPYHFQQGPDVSSQTSEPRASNNDGDDDVREVGPSMLTASTIKSLHEVKKRVALDDVDVNPRTYKKHDINKRKPKLNPLHTLTPLDDGVVVGSVRSHELQRRPGSSAGDEDLRLSTRLHTHEDTSESDTFPNSGNRAVVETTGEDCRVEKRTKSRALAARAAAKASPHLVTKETGSLITGKTNFTSVNSPPLLARSGLSKNMKRQADLDAAIPEQAPNKSTDVIEPMIELRIKRRKKRGLLMLSGETVVRKLRRAVEADACITKNAKTSDNSGHTEPTAYGYHARDASPANAFRDGIAKLRPAMDRDSTSADDFDADMRTLVDDQSTHIGRKTVVRAAEHQSSSFEAAQASRSSATKAKTVEARPDRRDHLQLAGPALNTSQEDCSQVYPAPAVRPIGDGRRRQAAESDDPFEQTQSRPNLEKVKQHRVNANRVIGSNRSRALQQNKSLQMEGTIEEEEPIESPKRPRMHVNCSSSDEGPSFKVANTLPQPRLAHMSRKNIKSKEVIGLFFDEDDDAPPRHVRSCLTDVEKERGCGQDAGIGSGTSAKHLKSDSGDVTSRESLMPPNNHRQQFGRNLHSTPSLLQKTQGSQPAQVAQTEEANARTLECPSTQAQNQSEPAAARPEVIDQSNSHPRAKTSRREVDGLGDIPNVPKEWIDPLANPEAMGLQCAPGDTSALLSASDQDVASPTPRVQPIAKIVNPATRGRKAAQPSDAAGHVPLPVLPSDVTSERWHSGGTVVEASAKHATQAVVLPGFARANGGPWSREAFDLFEFTRPA